MVKTRRHVAQLPWDFFVRRGGGSKLSADGGCGVPSKKFEGCSTTVATNQRGHSPAQPPRSTDTLAYMTSVCDQNYSIAAAEPFRQDAAVLEA
jgi:hypothetical protein